jgi:hypothetical protein
MSWNTSFEQAIGARNREMGASSSELRHLFDLDDNVTDAQLRDMVTLVQVSCSKEGLPKPIPYSESLKYVLVGYDDILRKELRSKDFIFSPSTIGEIKKIQEVILNFNSLKEQGIAPINLIDGEGRKWKVVLDK